MNNYMSEFVNSIKSDNSKKVARHVFKKIDNVDIKNYNLIQLEQLILNADINSPKDIITIIYILSSYVKWLQENGIVKNDDMYQMLQSLDKKLLWKKISPYAKKKFISYKQYEQITKEIATYEEYNSLYFELLFSCIYYGIYSDNMSVLKNLKRSDIQEDGVIILREDNGHIYKIKVPERLAKDLVQLSTINEWVRPNRFGLCHVEMKGTYVDSVFKVENRSTNSESSYKFSYYNKLRKISREYIGHSLLPLQLYASGIMHRIKVELNKNNISLEEAFSKNNRNKTAHMIIEKELVRCNSGIEISNFRELVKGHLNSF
jgi:hypothetical protein